jgi:hypothetical protein
MLPLAVSQVRPAQQISPPAQLSPDVTQPSSQVLESASQVNPAQHRRSEQSPPLSTHAALHTLLMHCRPLQQASSLQSPPEF